MVAALCGPLHPASEPCDVYQENRCGFSSFFPYLYILFILHATVSLFAAASR